MAREVSISFALTAALTGGFKGAFQSAAQSARNVASAIREMEKSPVGKLGQSMAQQREKIKGLAGSLKEAKATLATLQSQAQASGGATGMLARQIELAQQRVNNLNGAMTRQLGLWRNTAAQAATTGGSVRKLAQDYDHLSQRIERARKAQAAMAANRAQGDALRAQRADLNSKLAGAMGAAATVAIPAKLSIDFEDSIAQVGAVANASDEDLQRLTNTARQLGRDTMFSASQAAEGMKYLAMAGFNTNQTIDAMPGMLDLAAAANTDLGTTADIASDIMTAFSLKASDMGTVANTLAKTFTNSNTDLSMLGETMKYVAPVAGSLKMSLQDTAAMAGAMANAGIKASQGGTVLRAALLRLSAPPKMAKEALGELAGVAGDELDELYDMVGDSADAANALQELGMTTKDEAGNLRPMVDIIEELNARTAKMGTAEKAEVFKKVFGTEASAGMIALAEQASKTVDDAGNQIVDSTGKQTNALRKMMDTVNNYEGTTKKIADKMNATTGGSLRRLKSAWEDAGISVGNLFLPAIQTAAGALSTVANAISGFTQRFPTLSKYAALAVGGILAFTAASVGIGLVVNLVKSSINGWSGALLKLSSSQIASTATTAAQTAATGAFGIASRVAGAGAKFFAGGLRSILVATGVGALLVGLGFAINLLIENWDAVVAAMSSAWAWVKATWGKLCVFFSELGKNLVGVFAPIWDKICAAAAWAKDVVMSVWNGIAGFFSGLWNGIVSGVKAYFGFIFNLITSPVQTIKNAWASITNFFSGLWSGVSDSASGIGSGIIGFFRSAYDSVLSVWNSIIGFFSGLWDGIVSGVSSFVNGIKSAFGSAIAPIKAIWNGLVSFYSGLWNTIIGGVKAYFSFIYNLITSPIQTIKNAWASISNFFSNLFGSVSNVISTVWNYILGAATAAKNALMAIWNGLTQFFPNLCAAISAIVSSLWQGICDAASWAYETVAGLWNGAVEFFGGITDSISAAFTWAHDTIVGLWEGAVETFSSIGQGIADAFGSVWQGIADAANWCWETIAGIWNGVAEFFSGIVDGIFGVFTGLFDWLAEKFAWVTSAIDGISSVIGGITGAVKGAWNAAFGSDDKGSEKAAEKAAEKSAAPAAQKAQAQPVAQASAPAKQPAQFTAVSRSAVQAAKPEPEKKKGGKKAGSSGGGSRKKSGAGGAGGSGSRSGSGSSAGSGASSGGPVTVVTLDGGEASTHTTFIPAKGREAAPAAARSMTAPVNQQGGLLSMAAQTVKNTATSMASSVFGSGKSATAAGGAIQQAASAQKPAIPQSPGMIAKKNAQKQQGQQASESSISIDLTQNFDLITQDASAARKILEAIKPDMEALIRKALAKINSDRSRTAYAQ